MKGQCLGKAGIHGGTFSIQAFLESSWQSSCLELRLPVPGSRTGALDARSGRAGKGEGPAEATSTRGLVVDHPAGTEAPWAGEERSPFSSEGGPAAEGRSGLHHLPHEEDGSCRRNRDAMGGQQRVGQSRAASALFLHWGAGTEMGQGASRAGLKQPHVPGHAPCTPAASS